MHFILKVRKHSFPQLVKVMSLELPNSDVLMYFKA